MSGAHPPEHADHAPAAGARPDPELLAAAEHADVEVLRETVRAWVSRHVPSLWLEAALAGDLARLHDVRSPQAYREWYPVLGSSGMVGPTWPMELGGLGMDAHRAQVVREELRRARLVTLNIIGVALVAPTLLEYGSREQQAERLPAIATDTESWCQLFSEPGAGSDLAGLATRAQRVGDDWRVTGQKLWSSFASEATHGLLLARTDPDLPKHQGITAFLLDMRQDGVDVRPLQKITGEREFNEVFLDDAHVSDRDRLGDAGAGWAIARSVLAHERTMLSGAGSGLRDRTSGSSIEYLLQLAVRGDPGSRPVEDPVWRDRLGQLYVESMVLRLTNRRSQEPDGRVDPGLLKIMASEHNQRLQNAIFDVLGDRGLSHDADDNEAARAVFGYLRSKGDTIGGGTSEVHRNNVAERTLNLPRDPFSDKETPWRDIPRGSAGT